MSESVPESISDNKLKLPIASREILKILVLGSSNVGKTSLVERFALEKFTGIRRPTVGADFMTKKIIIRDTEVVIQMWDTAGMERFHQGTLGAGFYRGSNGALLVYDVNNEKSFEQLAMWRDEAISKIDSDDFFPMVVVGNKVDLRDNTPSVDRADQSSVLEWCRDNSYGHIETSAKDGNGVQAAMAALAALALEAKKAQSTRNKKSFVSSKATVRISELYKPKRNSNCSGCS